MRPPEDLCDDERGIFEVKGWWIIKIQSRWSIQVRERRTFEALGRLQRDPFRYPVADQKNPNGISLERPGKAPLKGTSPGRFFIAGDPDPAEPSQPVVEGGPWLFLRKPPPQKGPGDPRHPFRHRLKVIVPSTQ